MQEAMSNQEKADSLKNLVESKGWSILQAHLEWHLTKKERVKAEAIRQDKSSEIRLNQGWIDGVSFVLKEPAIIITRLKSEEIGEENAKP